MQVGAAGCRWGPQGAGGGRRVQVGAGTLGPAAAPYLAVRRKVLRLRDESRDVGVRVGAADCASLNARRIGNPHGSDKVGVLAKRLLEAPEARVRVDLELGGEGLYDTHDARLGADDRRSCAHEVCVPGAAQADGRREDRGLQSTHRAR